MAVVPMGTANDFATSLGLPEDPWEALQLCVLDTAHPIDVGQVNEKVCIAFAVAYSVMPYNNAWSCILWLPDRPASSEYHYV